MQICAIMHSSTPSIELLSMELVSTSFLPIEPLLMSPGASAVPPKIIIPKPPHMEE
jgi:hypothetical protein